MEGLAQFSKFSVHINEAKVRVLTPSLDVVEFGKRNLGNSSGALAIAENMILLTGRWASNPQFQRQAIKLVMPRGTMTEVAPLNVGRGFHTMSWINDQPAVIGGKDPDDNKLNSVEVFDGNRWVEIAPLNLARDNTTACCTGPATYVIGGWIEEGGVLKKTATIEKFMDNAWHILDLTLPVPSARTGAIPRSESSFLVLGGIIEPNDPTGNVWVVSEQAAEPVAPLEGPCCFEFNMFVVGDSLVSALDRNGKVISYAAN